MKGIHAPESEAWGFRSLSREWDNKNIFPMLGESKPNEYMLDEK